ncbi:MAG TPA: septal ring lytic transglycosylase RlpA family lipoprotein, partial [Methylocystis sp.]
MDVSERVAEALDFRSTGTARVKVEWVGRAELSGSDTNKLLASLRTDGQPATLEGFESPVMVAEREAPVRTAYNEPPRREFVDGGDGAARSYAPASETQGHSSQDDMTALVKSVDGEADNTGSASTRVGSRSSRAAAPLPPTRPYDLGGASSQKGVKEASN